VDEKSSKRGLSIFSSCAAAPSDRNLVSLYLAVGCNYVGLLPCRENDIFGVAASYTKVGDAVVGSGSVVHSVPRDPYRDKLPDTIKTSISTYNLTCSTFFTRAVLVLTRMHL
jgi:hypothetical protein